VGWRQGGEEQMAELTFVMEKVRRGT